MGWNSVNAGWRARRSPWVAEVGAASSNAQVAALLGELEAATQWSAVSARWRARRPGWVVEIRTVR